MSAAIDPTDLSIDPSLGAAVLVDVESTSAVADLAAENNIPLYELVTVGATVEDVYLQMTQEWEQYRSGSMSGTAPVVPASSGKEAK